MAILLVAFFVCVFFFKQKTAYEMRISDWSSDVCSSDLALNLEYDFGPVTAYSITSYWNGNFRSRGDIDGGFVAVFLPESGPGLIPFQAQSQDNVPSLDQFTQEIRIASNNSGGLGYQFGAFYFDEKLDISSFEFGGPTDATPPAIAVQRQDSEAYGIFGSVNYEFEGGFKLQAGARYNHDTRDFVASRPVETRPDFVVNPNTPVPRSEEHTSELQSLMRISYAVFCLKKNTNTKQSTITTHSNDKQT